MKAVVKIMSAKIGKVIFMIEFNQNFICIIVIESMWNILLIQTSNYWTTNLELWERFKCWGSDQQKLWDIAGIMDGCADMEEVNMNGAYRVKTWN